LCRARAAYARRDLDEAAVILEEILLKNRNNAATWAALSAVREDQGRISEAEQAIVMADKLAPFDAVYPARLGAILAAWYGGRQDDNAVKAYRRALQRPGRNPHLLYALGKLEQRGAGNPEASLQALKMFLVAVPEGEDADRARQQIENLLRARPPELHAPPARARPADVSTLAWFEFHLAYIYFEESTDNRVDDDDVLLARAVDSILLAREDAPDFIDAINLEAQIRVKGAEFETAIALWERSLALDGDQAAVVLDMAGVHGQLGNTVRQDALLSRAEALGDPDTLLKRAHQQRAASEWWAARETLERYFATAPPGSPSYANAGTLRDDVDRRILGIYGGFGAGIVGVFALPILIRWYRHSGVGVRQLLEGSPAAYRDVARICSAIRHEVLKHNTTVLVSVADAMEEGDLEPARWAAEKLYGKRGAVVRFREYIADLELLGRVHGVRLNLRHRDALFGPLIDAVDRLSRL
jgi:tetratricopeptide (TPR) repeat protein